MSPQNDLHGPTGGPERSTAAPFASAAPASRLHPEDRAALAREVAQHLANLLQAPSVHSSLVDARTAAQALSVDIKTVYRHKHELGGIKVGAAWRFDLDRARAALAEGVTDRESSERSEPSKSAATTTRKRRRRRTSKAPDCQLLPVGRVETRI